MTDILYHIEQENKKDLINKKENYTSLQALGSNIENTQPGNIKSASLDDYEYQKILNEIFKSHAGYCGYYPLKDNETGEVIPPEARYHIEATTGKKLHFHTNLQLCGSPWKCLRCSKVKAQQENIAINFILRRAAEEGKHVSMVTFTVPHKLGDSLDFTIDSLFAAVAKLKNSKRFKSYKLKLGYFGDIRSLEILDGEYGWHPHIHLGVITDLPMNEELIEEFRFMYELAFKNVNSKRRIGKKGFDVSYNPQVGNWDSFAEYLTKVEWGIKEELTQGLKKKSTGKSFWNMVEEAGKQMEAGKEANKEKEAEREKIEGSLYIPTPLADYVSKYLKERIIEYCIATKNRRKIVFSDGLRAYGELQKKKEATENELKEVGKGLAIKYKKMEWLAIEYYINPDKFIKKLNEDEAAALIYLKDITKEYLINHPYTDTRWNVKNKAPCLSLYNLPDKDILQ